MSKRLVFVLVTVMIIAISTVAARNWPYTSIGVEKVDFDGRTIFYQGRRYTIDPAFDLIKTNIGNKIAKTKDGLFIYDIIGFDRREWLSIGSEGWWNIYKEESTAAIEIEDFEVDEIEIISYKVGWKTGGNKKLTDKILVDQLVAVLQSDYHINPRDLSSLQPPIDTKEIYLKSNKFKGLAYVFHYQAHAQGKVYLINGWYSKAYEIGDLLSR